MNNRQVFLVSLVPISLGIAALAASGPIARGPRTPPYALGGPFPGNQDIDTANALEAPGVYAWKIFVNINRPALSVTSRHRGVAKPLAHIGGEGYTVWQTWKFPDEVFLENGHKPAPFDAPPPGGLPYKVLDPPKSLRILLSGFFKRSGSTFSLMDSESSRATFNRLKRGMGGKIDFDGKGELRMNRVSFNYIRDHALYNVEGQERFRASGKAVDFPRGSMEVSVAWKDLGLKSEKRSDRAEYHCIVFPAKGPKARVYGLASIGIMSKDLPNWFWCTFEHYRNPTPIAPDQHLPDIDPAENPEFELFRPDRNKALAYPVPRMLMRTVWRYYRLRGTMTDFTSSTGVPLTLANTVLEGAFQTTSSCISCHAKAAIGDRKNLPIYSVIPPFGFIFDEHDNRLHPLANQPVKLIQDNPIGPIGVPDMRIFGPDINKPSYSQQDYAYSLSRAHRWKR